MFNTGLGAKDEQQLVSTFLEFRAAFEKTSGMLATGC